MAVPGTQDKSLPHLYAAYADYVRRTSGFIPWSPR